MYRTWISFLLMIIVIEEQEGPATADPWTQNEAIRKKLLTNYDKMVLPSHVDNGTTTVYVLMMPRAVWIDDMKQRLVVNAWIAFWWHDARLAWDYKDYGNLAQVHFGDDELWKPDLTAYNNADIVDVDHYGSTHMVVYSYGYVMWVPPSHTETECDIDLRLWPFDTQTCHIEFGSWTSHGWQIGLELWHNVTELSTEELIKNSHNWQLQESTQERKTTKYECCDEPYYTMIFTFVMKRQSPTFAAVVLVPAIVTPLLLLLQYILPVDHPKRMSIGFCCLLIVALELMFLKMVLPGLTSSVPLIVSYYSQSFIIVVLTIACSTVLSRLSHPQHPLLSFAPPPLLKSILTGPLATVLLLRDHASTVGLSGKGTIEEGGEDGEVLEKSGGQSNYSHEWLFIAKVTDRIVVILMAVIYVLSLISYLGPI